MVVEYDGTDYCGFQIQPNVLTIQGTLQQKLEKVLGEEVVIIGASRTDAGVHARGQVISFTTENAIPAEGLCRALNDLLPVAINCVVAGDAQQSFHPRFDAREKLYSYRILNRPARSPFLERYMWHLAEPQLDVQAMQQAAEALVGEHDFAAFCAAGSQVENTVREIRRIEIHRAEDVVEAFITGNSFLYMMVRIIMGTLVEVGCGKRSPDDVGEILASKDRNKAGSTAPPQGLCLVRVDY